MTVFKDFRGYMLISRLHSQFPPVTPAELVCSEDKKFVSVDSADKNFELEPQSWCYQARKTIWRFPKMGVAIGVLPFMEPSIWCAVCYGEGGAWKNH